MKTGFEELDKVIDLEKSGLIVLGARPAMGKSTFALNIATNVAVKTGTSVAIFSLEMSKEAIVNRILCSQAMVDSRKVRTGKIDSEEWLKISEGLSSLLEAGIYLDDTPGITINELTAKSRKLKLEKNIGLIVIDYLQLMGFADKSQCLSRIQEVSEIFRRLKILSQELNVPIIIVSQLSRAPEKEKIIDQYFQIYMNQVQLCKMLM